MTITEDTVNQPAPWQYNAGSATTSPAFNVTAGQLLVVETCADDGTTPVTFAVSDNQTTHLNWTRKVQQNSASGNETWIADVPSNITGLTVTITPTRGWNFASSGLACVRILNGAETVANQNGATATASANSVSITPTYAGSRIYGTTTSDTQAFTPTANADTTVISSFNSGGGGFTNCLLKAAADTPATPAAITIGLSNGGGNRGIALVEIRPATGGGGTTLTDTENDTENLTDSLTVAETFHPTQSDNLPLNETLNVAQAHNQAIVNDLSISDSFTVVLDNWFPEFDDTASLTDSINTALQMAFAKDDPLALSDNMTVSQIFNASFIDTCSLTDLLSFATLTTITDSAGLNDTLTVALLYMNGYLDLNSITDQVTVNLVNNGQANILDVLGLSDALTITGVQDADMSNLSLVDRVMLWLGQLGYEGTIQDRQYYYLLDKYVNTFGQPEVSLTQGDLQWQLSGKVKEVLQEADYV